MIPLAPSGPESATNFLWYITNLLACLFLHKLGLRYKEHRSGELGISRASILGATLIPDFAIKQICDFWPLSPNGISEAQRGNAPPHTASPGFRMPLTIS